MANGYVLTSSSAKLIKAPYILTGGKVFPAEKAYVLTGGTARLWYQRGTPLGNLTVGSTVKIAVGGTDYDWLVVHQGLPGSMYDVSCNGTWLMMKDVYYKESSWGDTSVYSQSELHSNLLNETFYNSIALDIRKSIKQVKIPTQVNGKPQSGKNGLSTKVFILSEKEVCLTGGYSKEEGAKLSYFSDGTDDAAKKKRIAYYNGEAWKWWLRTEYMNDYPCFVTTSGGLDYVHKDYSYRWGCRPCMILPSDALVDDTGHVIGVNESRTPLGWCSVGSTIKMDINGNKRIWSIAYKGNPNPDLYDESCNGVWLVLNTIYSTRANGSDCQYADGTIDTYLNSTFLNRIDKNGNAAKYIKDVKIPYAKKLGDGSWKVQTKESGLPCKVFLPSVFEIGGSENASVYKDGSALGYYDGSPSTLTLKLSGTPAAWRTRTVTSDAQSELSIDASGAITTCAPTDVIGVVPCVIMKPDALVENGIIVGE